jgi:hypothetical protein
MRWMPLMKVSFAQVAPTTLAGESLIELTGKNYWAEAKGKK